MNFIPNIGKDKTKLKNWKQTKKLFYQNPTSRCIKYSNFLQCPSCRRSSLNMIKCSGINIICSSPLILMTTALGIHINKGSWNFSMSMGSLAPSRKHKHPLTGKLLDHFLLVILNINKMEGTI